MLEGSWNENVTTLPRQAAIEWEMVVAPRAGFGPATSGLVVRRSIPLSYRGALHFHGSGVIVYLEVYYFNSYTSSMRVEVDDSKGVRWREFLSRSWVAGASDAG